MACMISLAGCASTTPVMPLGSGEATVTAQTDWMSGGAAGAQARVTESAQAHCAAQGKAVQPGELLRNIDQYRGLYDFSLRFRCV
jgi:hypothetical protein